MAHTKKGRKVALVAGLALVVLSVAVVWTYWGEIGFFLNFERLGKNEQGYPEYRHRETGIVFVGLPGGTFEMGTPVTARESPVHDVTLSPFLIAKYEVTQAEWKKFVGNNPSEFKGDSLPVEQVSWDDCHEFCSMTGLSLPTEAQWEYACRAGKPGPFSGTGNLDDMGWYIANSNGSSHPVGEKLPNDFGLHDMHGNVSEFCEDYYEDDFYSEFSGEKDPICEDSDSQYRARRGSGWNSLAKNSRSAFRGKLDPSRRGNAYGFRAAWSPP